MIPSSTEKKLKRVKLRLLQMHFKSGVGHIGGNLSCVDTIFLLHNHIMQAHDLFILAKGHAAGALYVSLWAKGELSENQLRQFHQDGSKMSGHPIPGWTPGITVATGSLGHGFSLACGIALAKKLRAEPGRVFCLTSDGEWQEGSNWEGLIFANHNRLDNLTLLVDSNSLQGFGTVEEVASMGNLRKRISSFGIPVREIDGHDLNEIDAAINKTVNQFEVIILRTTKGKGVSFMENRLEWHYLPLDEDKYRLAVSEVEMT